MPENLKEIYKERLIDQKISQYLDVFGAIFVEGPKWCGKTWTSAVHAKTMTFMDDVNTKNAALLDVYSIFARSDEKPQLIDEWHLVPEIWDAVRRECDKTIQKGNFILTGSTILPDEIMKTKVTHSGAGRIARIKMFTMSLYESGDSTGKASILDMYHGTQKNCNQESIKLIDLAALIVRGGWPANLNVSQENIGVIPKSYIDTILNVDMFEMSEHRRDRNKMQMLLRSLARNETTVVGNKTILKDIEEYENDKDLLSSRDTILEYLDILNRLYLIENQDAYSINYRSPERVGKSPKRHFTDPSLACACLNLTPQKLLKDLKTFGLLFEALVERDLRIYMNYLNGQVYHFRDNVSGLEVDAILEFPDGDYAAVEIKLGFDKVMEAKKNLQKFSDNMNEKPVFMCIITGNFSAVVKDPETGIYIVPITALKP